MKRNFLILIFLIGNAFVLYARESTPLSELQMIGNFISKYYERNSIFPSTLDELKKMPYFTNDDIEKRLNDLQNRFELYISGAGVSWISINLVDDKIIYTLRYEIGNGENFYFYANEKLISTYHRGFLSENKEVKQVPNIIVTTK